MTTPFDTLVPTSRTFSPGNYTVKTYAAINGTEHRLLYGNTRTQMTIGLTFANISDSEAASILAHFDQMAGTFLTFYLPAGDQGAKGGWKANDEFQMNANGGGWRYDAPPTMTSVYPGISTVTVTLRGVH
tara:strand:+ start:19254 stop:19643 length:390 start_codon:yes stop_codon:yes gene_type:complete